MAPKLAGLERETRGLKAFPLLTLLGWVLVGFSIIISIFVLSPTGSAYWGENAKAARDAAEAGANLLGDLNTLSYWPKILAPLTFLGVASFMIGIAMEFSSIPAIIERRAAILKQALPLMGRK